MQLYYLVFSNYHTITNDLLNKHLFTSNIDISVFCDTTRVGDLDGCLCKINILINITDETVVVVLVILRVT